MGASERFGVMKRVKNTENNGDVYLSTGCKQDFGNHQQQFHGTPLVAKPPRRKKRHLHDQHEFVAILTLSIV